MITIQILGLDHFVVGQYSREHTANLAQLFETNEDEINFGSTETVIIHNGVEQTSWNVLVLVHASHQYEPLEESIASYLLKTLAPFAIHITVEFDYFEPHAHYVSVNDKYPLFITAEQVHDITYEEGEDEDSCDHGHEEDEAEEPELDPNNENEIYLGNAFEGFEEKLAEAAEAKKKA